MEKSVSDAWVDYQAFLDRDDSVHEMPHLWRAKQRRTLRMLEHCQG